VAVSTSAGPDLDVTAPSWPAPSSPCSPGTDATSPDIGHPLAGTRLLAAGSGLPPPHPTRAPAGVVVAVTDMMGSAAAGRRAAWAPLLRRVGLLLAAVWTAGHQHP
jgi:hypothetical protein